MVAATVNSVTTSFVYRGDGLRDSRAVSGGATTQFTWDIAGGLPVVLDDGNQYVYGAGQLARSGSGVGGGPTPQRELSDPLPQQRDEYGEWRPDDVDSASTQPRRSAHRRR